MNHREMAQLAANPHAVRSRAAYLIERLEYDLGDGARSFLSDLLAYDGTKPLSSRQKEMLHGLRQQATRSKTAGRYRADALVLRAWEHRLDLSDDDAEEWLDSLYKKGPSIDLSETQWHRLFAICRRPEIDLLPHDEWIKVG
jgi:hypothetical protein